MEARRRTEPVGVQEEAFAPFVVEGVRIEMATEEEWQAMLEELAQRELGMSAEAFCRAYQAGELDPEAPEVARVAILLPSSP